MSLCAIRSRGVVTAVVLAVMVSSIAGTLGITYAVNPGVFTNNYGEFGLSRFTYTQRTSFPFVGDIITSEDVNLTEVDMIAVEFNSEAFHDHWDIGDREAVEDYITAFAEYNLTGMMGDTYPGTAGYHVEAGIIGITFALGFEVHWGNGTDDWFTLGFVVTGTCKLPPDMFFVENSTHVEFILAGLHYNATSETLDEAWYYLNGVYTTQSFGGSFYGP